MGEALEPGRRPHLVARRHHLHRRGLQGQGQADLHERGRRWPTRSTVFNASLDAGTRRAIDLNEGDELDAKAFVALVRAAVEHNTGGG